MYAHCTVVKYYLSCASGTFRRGDARAGGLLHGRQQRVVFQVEPLERPELAEADGQPLDLIGVEVEVTQVSQLAKVFRQLVDPILAQIQLDDVDQSGKVLRQSSQPVVGQVQRRSLGDQGLGGQDKRPNFHMSRKKVTQYNKK